MADPLQRSTIAGASTSLTGGELSTLSFGSCKPLQEPPGIQECYSAEILHLPYGVAFVTGEPGNEKGVGVERMRLSNGGNGNPSFKLNCEVSGFKFWCAYAAEKLDLALVGGELPEIWINKELLILSESSSKTLCATEMGWSGIYSVSAPSPLFLSGL